MGSKAQGRVGIRGGLAVVAVLAAWAGASAIAVGDSPAQCGHSYYGQPPPTADTAPTASFSYTPAAPQAGIVVAFDASASTDADGDPIVAYFWDFGDGTPAAATPGAKVQHSYARSGTFTVRLSVQDCRDTGSAIASAPVTVAPAPTPAPKAAPPDVGSVSVPGTVTESGTRLVIPLACHNASSQCTGRAALTARVRIRGRKIVGEARRRRPRLKTRTEVVGQTSYTLAPGQASTIVLSLNAQGRRLLARFGRLPTRLTITPAGGAAPITGSVLFGF